jgi:M6 family metalloprotease-like protein
MNRTAKAIAFSTAGLLAIGGLAPAMAQEKLATSPVETCKVKTVYDVDLSAQPWWAESNVGFPKSKLRLPGKGTIKAVMLYVQFKDVKGSGSTAADSKQFTDYLNGYFSSVSRKRLRFDVTVPKTIFSIPKNSSVYKMNVWNQGDPHSYAQDALTAADPFVDFTGVDVVYVIPPKKIRSIVYGPAFPLDSGGFTLDTNEGPIMSMAVGGADSRNFPDAKPGVWIVHETGHLFGMPHPYADANVAAWDLMNWDNGVPEFLGWNRFINGWVGDNEVVCVDLRSKNSGAFSVNLEPLSRVAKGNKLIVLRTSNSKIVVLENRRATKYDKLTSNNEGVIAYEVDLTKYGGKQIRLLSRGNTMNGWPLGTLRPGNSVTFGKTKASVVSKNNRWDTVRISVDK